MQVKSPPSAARPRTKLTVEAEAALLSVSSFQDSLDRRQAAAVAARAGCTKEEALAFFSNLKQSVRTLLQRVQREPPPGSGQQQKQQQQPDSAANGGEAGGGAWTAARAVAHVNTLATQRHQAALALQPLIDAGGGLGDGSGAEVLAALAARAEGTIVRCALLQALCATRDASARTRLLAAPGLLATLERWRVEAEADRQCTLLRLVLLAMHALGVTQWLANVTGTLGPAVHRLSHHTNPHVAAAAAGLAEDWRKAAPPGAGGPAGAAATMPPPPAPRFAAAVPELVPLGRRPSFPPKSQASAVVPGSKRAWEGAGAAQQQQQPAPSLRHPPASFAAMHAAAVARQAQAMVPFAPPPDCLPSLAIAVARGEESVEAPAQGKLHALSPMAGPAATPAEPPEELAQPAVQPAVVPWDPADPKERASQDAVLKAAGVQPQG